MIRGKALGLMFLFIAAFASAKEPADVSVVQLLANPDYFHGRSVRVVGFLHVKFEDSVLYLSKESADYLIGRNGLWVTYAQKPELEAMANGRKLLSRDEIQYFDGKCVLIEGIFNEEERGHLGTLAAGITNVTRVMEMTRYFDGKLEVKHP